MADITADKKNIDVPDRSPGVPADLTKIMYLSLFGPFFIIKSSYFKPGSLGKSPEDMRESFLNIWL